MQQRHWHDWARAGLGTRSNHDVIGTGNTPSLRYRQSNLPTYEGSTQHDCKKWRLALTSVEDVDMQLSSTVSEPCCGVFLRVPAGFFSMTKWILCPTINPDSAKSRGVIRCLMILYCMASYYGT